MISIIHPSIRGVTYGIENIIKAMQDHADNLLEVVKVSKIREEDGTWFFAWVVIFRERGTIGQLVGLVNQWGTNFGPSAGGVGSGGYCQMMSYIEDNGLSVTEIDWNEIDSRLQARLDASSRYECCRAWEQLIIEHGLEQLFDVLPSVHYPINESWAHRREHMRER